MVIVILRNNIDDLSVVISVNRMGWNIDDDCSNQLWSIG